MSKIGRNDPCPCGSNLKAKRCCWDDIRRVINVDKRALQIGEPGFTELMDDLETDKYGIEYVNERAGVR